MSALDRKRELETKICRLQGAIADLENELEEAQSELDDVQEDAYQEVLAEFKRERALEDWRYQHDRYDFAGQR